MSERIKLRVKFRKFGAVRYIGHLDVMRFFQKAIRRAEIDVSYTGGFSPHQIMSFASPLSVGLESNGEYMDIDVNSMISCEDIKNRLNEASVNGIEVVSVKILPEGAGNAMASVAAAAYTVSFKADRYPNFDIEASLPTFMAQEIIAYTKETKKGIREMNLKDGIFELSWENDHFHMLVDASSAGNIKPIQILEAFCRANGDILKENALIVTREETYTNVGSAENPQLVPLDAVGILDKE